MVRSQMNKILFLFLVTVIAPSGLKAQPVIDVLLEKLNYYNSKGVSDTAKAQVLIDLSYEYHRSEPAKGVLYGMQALTLADSLKWKKGIASSNNRVGLSYWAQSDFAQALEYQFHALQVFEEIDDRNGIATVLGNIGLAYDGQQDYTKALNYHFRALEINRQLENNDGIARNYGNIGIVYDEQENSDKALEYYFKALSLYEQLRDTNGIARNLGNIGYVYQMQHEHLKALEYYSRALEMNRQVGSQVFIAMNIGNIGETYYNIAANIDSLKGNLPDSLSKNIALNKAELFLQESVKMYEQINHHSSLQELYAYQSDLYFLTGDYKKSLESYKKHIRSKEIVFSEENKNKIARLEKNREEDLKQKEIELLKSQNEIERLTAQRRKGMNYGLGGAFIGLGFVTLAFFNQSRKRERINNQLQKAYTDLKDTQDELLRQQKLASLGKLTSNLSHELQNPLNFVNNFSLLSGELSSELSSATSETERQEIISVLQDNMSKIYFHGQRADKIVKKMQQHVLDGSGLDLFDEA
jgi:two-component system, NtrC family, sensor kinase